VIWIRTGNLKTNQIAEVLTTYYEEIEAFNSNVEYGCFEIHYFKN